MPLSNDALIFGLAHLASPKATLSFGGEGAKMAITKRARAALSELIAEGYAVTAEPSDSIPYREFYRGTNEPPALGALAILANLDPFDPQNRWVSFEPTVASPAA